MEASKNVPPLPEDEVKQVVDTWISVLKTPTVAGGYIYDQDPNFLTVNSKWTVDDAAKKERLTFSRSFAVLKSSLAAGQKPAVSSPGPVTIDEKLAVPSKSGRLRAVLVEKKESAASGDASGSSTEYLQIWTNSGLEKTYNLSLLDLHKNVYTSAGWGVTMCWNQSETKLAYLAEKKVPKAKSFYTSAHAPAAPDEGANDVKKATETKIGEEYVYKQSWGEQLTGHYFSVIVVLDLVTDEFQVLSSLPDNQFPTDIQWIGDTHICGTTYPLPVWRLGLIYCSNRESLIFSVGADGTNFQLLTQPGKACRSARVRPDGNYLVYQQRILDGAHDRARSLNGLPLSNGLPTGPSEALYPANPLNGLPIYQDFSRNCWTPDGTNLLAVTSNEAESILLAISIPGDGSPALDIKKISGVDSLLAVSEKYLLVGSSSTLTTPHLKLLDISQDFRSIAITESSALVDFQTLQQYVSGETSPPAIYTGPALDSVPPNSIPLIVWPHGGPHATFVDSFTHEAVFFLRLGFALLRLNYVGSTGGIRDTADDLLGKIGDRDVKDCQEIVNKVLNSMPSLNPDQVVVFGGSHGGFLSAHLSCQYPDIYKAAVMRNPVTDVGTMVGITDITDWVYAESGVKFPEPPVQTLIPAVRNLEDAEKYIKASPIHLADRVKGATLLLLGSEDLRVPPQQGLDYYRALKAYGKVAEVRMYPDCHPLSKAPVRLDNIIHSALWFKRYLR